MSRLCWLLEKEYRIVWFTGSFQTWIDGRLVQENIHDNKEDAYATGKKKFKLQKFTQQKQFAEQEQFNEKTQ